MTDVWRQQEGPLEAAHCLGLRAARGAGGCAVLRPWLGFLV